MLIKMGDFSLTVKFYSKTDNFKWRCTSVYGPNVRSLKRPFWEELHDFCNDPSIPWVVCGDFNVIFALEEKPSGVPNLEDIRCANAFMFDLGLLEPPASGRKFTCTNGQADPIWVKLDRFVVNYAWVSCFPKLIQNNLPRLGSDNVPIRLEVGVHRFTPRPFRFELAWTTAEGFQELVLQWWFLSRRWVVGRLLLQRNCCFLGSNYGHGRSLVLDQLNLRSLC